MSQYEESINEHYGRRDVSESILAALRDAGKDVDALTREDLEALDQFHIGGVGATRELAGLAHLESGMHVLDLGCGVGGPARTLAAEFGCVVTGVDLTEEFCLAADMLTARVGLGESVSFRVGDAQKIPVDDASFDVAWMQHMSMNVEDKAAMFAEVRRILKPDGRLVIYEICAGPNRAALHFPLPWATDESLSFVVTVNEMCDALCEKGFVEVARRDVTALAIEWFSAMKSDVLHSAGAPPRVGLSTISGPDFPKRAANVRRNMEELKLVLIQAVYNREK